MEHGLLAKMSGVLLEYGYDLIRLTDKKRWKNYCRGKEER